MLKPFHPFPILETPRILLKNLETTHASRLFMLRTENDKLVFLERPRTRDIREVYTFIRSIRSGIGQGRWIYWAIVPRVRRKLAGTICLWNFNEADQSAEIGFELIEEYRRQGIMKEVLRPVLDFGFARMHLRMVHAVVHPDNNPSIQLLTAAGFMPEGRTGNMNRYILPLCP